MKAGFIKVAAVGFAASLLAGCIGYVAHKGAVVDPQLAAAIQPGIDNKASVEKTLGRPSFDGQFTSNDWYYVSRDTRQFAFRNPSTTKQTVVHVRFDQAGNVQTVEQSGKELVMNINPVGKKTPTLGRKRSFFDELFGNIGTVGAAGPSQPQY
jgi:outer membrane protein assembly factor BamE (lipoprotein component of BamABCDE complex)